MNRFSQMAFALALLVVVPGCGDDEEDGRTTSGPSGSSSSSSSGSGASGGSSSSGTPGSGGESTGPGGQGGGGEGGSAQGGAGGEGGSAQGGNGGMGGSASVCGDGVVDGAEACDDGDVDPDDGCSADCEVEPGWSCMGMPSVCMTGCGDGVIAGTETCDDGDTTSGDGCSSACAEESGWVCSGEPSACVTACGDGVPAGAEECDDQNVVAGDGCDAACVTEDGYVCTGAPSVCATDCGDSLVAGSEECDDGDTTAGDGCGATCAEEAGFACTGEPSVCVATCGDGVKASTEACDDGDAASGDGCSATCVVEMGWACTGQTLSTCTTICGDDLLVGTEQCDDGNTATGDCCSASCSVEPGCEIEVNDTQALANDFATIQLSNKVWGFITPDTDVDYWTVVVPAGPNVNLTAETVPGILGTACDNSTIVGGDSFVTIYDANGVSLDTDDDGGVDYCSLGIASNLAPGTYYIAVEASGGAAAASDEFDYGLVITTTQLICGNGIIEPPQACDDANTTAGDGCSATCTIEAGYTCTGQPSVCTNLPAASCANPIVVTGNDFQYAGTNIQQYGNDGNYSAPASCVDVGGTGGFDLVFRADMLAGESVRVREFGTLDAVVHVLTQSQCAGGSECVASYDFSETIGATYVAPAAGPVYIVLESYGNPAASTTFDLRIDRWQCGDGAITGPESCDDGNTTGGDGCSATCACETIQCALGACAGTVVTGSAAGLPLAIPDNVPNGGAVATIPIAATGTIQSMVVGFGATHTFDGDLDIFLLGPLGGAELDVSSDNGGSGEDYSGTYFKNGAPPITGGSAPFTGTFAPETSFGTFTGQSVTGTWTLRVADDASGDTGDVTAFTVGFCVTP
jgi:cysteine-rich repeat protein